MGSSASSDIWVQTYQQIKSKHNAAYQAIQEAITLEEQERPQDAIEKYKLGICLIDQSLTIPVSCPETTDSTWSEACQMIQKLKRTRGEVLTRITCIQNSPDYISHHCPPPPSYDEAMSSSTNSSVCGDVPRTYNELAAALQDLRIESNGGATPEVIFSVDHARLYFISPDGTVVSTSEPETLTISTIDCYGTSTASNQSIREAFIQVGDWVYPLVPGVSPCVRTEYGAFIVPDVNAPVNGSSVGIIIPEHAYETVYDLLENILHGIVNTTNSEEHRRRRDIRPLVPSREEVRGEPGNKVSSAILTGAYYISKGLIYGAEKASSLISYSTPKIIDHIEPAQQVTQVNPKVKQGFKIAKNATSKAATATGFVADQVGLATSRLGQYLAPHLQKQGTKLLSSGFNLSEADASSKVSGVLTVAAGAVEGFATVYRGLETSAGILGQNLKNNSVKIVKHKYGQAAGDLSNETFDTVGNVITIGHNAHVLKPRKIFKNIAKSTVSSIQSDNFGVAGPSGISGSSVSALPGPKSTSSGSAFDSDQKDIGDKEKQKFLEQEHVVNVMLQNNSLGEPDLDFNSDDLININWSTGTNTDTSVEKRQK